MPEPAPLAARYTMWGPWAGPSGPFCPPLAPRARFFAHCVRLPVHFLSFFSPTPTLPRFFYLSGGPGTPPDTKKPLKSLYCRRFSRVRRIRESALPRPLWGAIGITFGIILGVVGLLGALWGVPLRSQGCQNHQKGCKNRGVESVLAPTVSKRVPQGAQDLQNGPHLVEKLN